MGKVISQRREMEASEQFNNHLNQALDYAMNNRDALGAILESSILQILKGEAGKDRILDECTLDKAKTKQIVDFVAELMKNQVHKLKGHKNRCWYSPYLMGLSMNLYLQSEATAYDQLRADSVIIMASSDTLAKKKQAQKTMVGDCAIMYEKRLPARKFTEDIGELICNEMKLKQNVVMNVNYNTVIDFTEDFINKKTILKNLLDDDELNNMCKPATQVCQ